MAVERQRGTSSATSSVSSEISLSASILHRKADLIQNYYDEAKRSVAEVGKLYYYILSVKEFLIITIWLR